MSGLMTNEEAIKTLEANYPDACFEQLREAVDAAIEALKAQDADSDTISRKAAIEALKEAFNPSITNFVKAKIAIDNLPSAQPERTGRWEYVDYGGFGNYHCSACRMICICNGDYDYCPNCGARMEGES